MSSTADMNLDVSALPDDIREKLAELDLELSEGDITQKGYEKKRSRLLQPYMTKGNQAGPLASNVKRSGVDLSSQLAALSAEIAAKSNFKGCRPYNKNEQSSILPQSPLLQTRKYSGSGGSAGNSSASSSMEKQKQQQQVPLNSRTSSAAATATTGVTSPSHSILQTSANLLAPSAILAAVKSMQGNKVSKSASGNIKTTTTSNNNIINNNGNSRSKSESPSGTVLGGVGGHTGGGPPGGGRTTGCVVGNSAERITVKSDQSKNAQNVNANANAQCAQNNRPSRRLGRHESRYTSGKRNLI